MEKLTRVKAARRIYVLEDDGTVRIHKNKKKKKKQSKALKPLGKRSRRAANALRVAANHYLDRHDRSNQKKKDGWIRDLGKNEMKAARKGIKKVKIFKI